MQNMSSLQRYMMQRQAADGGMGPRGAGGRVATPIGPGIADPYNMGDQAPPMTNPDDGMNEFDSRRRMRPYMGDGGLSGQGMG